MVILIKNGLLYDGSGGPPHETDLLISGRKIARVGHIASRRHADRVLDATGCLVVPGFIDVHADPDYFSLLFGGDGGSPYLAQGITTIVGGNCGCSLAPLLHPSQFATTFKHRWRLNAHWNSLASFFDVIERRGIGVNFATSVGYASIADGITQGARRDLTEREYEACRFVLRESFKSGAVGVSVSLSDPTKRDVSSREMEMIFSLCGEEGRIISICLGDRERSLDRLEMLCIQASEKGVAVRVSHAEPRKGESGEALQKILLLHQERKLINCDLTPSAIELLSFVDLLPERWRTASWGEMRELLFLPHAEEELQESMSRKLREAKHIRIARVLDPSLKFLGGKTLQEFGAGREEEIGAASLALLRLTRLEAAFAVDDIDQRKVEEAIAEHEDIIISPFDEERGGFAGYVRRVREEKNVALERVIAQATSLPARKHGIGKRGLVREGYFADLVILKNDVPHFVLVNGKVAWEEGKCRRERSGMILRRH